MKTLCNITNSLVEKCLDENNKLFLRLLINWDKIVNQYSKITSPNKIKFPNNLRNNGKLILSVQRGFETEIQMCTPILINKINDFLGYKVISKIKIEQTILDK